MKKFILHIICWIFGISLTGIFLCFQKKYKFYGDTIVRQKIQYYEDHKDQYNAIILGSSRIYRQIDPKVLDSLTSHKIKAYSLAAGGTFFTENAYIYRQLDLKNVKYVFFEIQDLQPFEQNSYTEKVMYYHDLPTTVFEIKYFTQEKKGTSVFLAISHLISNIFYFKKIDQKNKNNDDFVRYDHGFYPLEKDEDMTSVKQQRQDYLKDTTQLSVKNAAIVKENKKILNPVLVNEIKILAKKCEDKKIQLILVLPPFATLTNLSEIKKIYGAKVVDFSSRTTFKEFYTYKNAYDLGHLNSRGSHLFTTKLADSLNSMLLKP